MNAKATRFAIAFGICALGWACGDPQGGASAGAKTIAVETVDPVRVETFAPQAIGTLDAVVVSYLGELSQSHARLDQATGDTGASQRAWEHEMTLAFSTQPIGATLADRQALTIAQVELFSRAASFAATSELPDELLQKINAALAADQTIPRSDATAKALVILGDQAALRGEGDDSMQSYMRAIRLLDQLRREEAAMPLPEKGQAR